MCKNVKSCLHTSCSVRVKVKLKVKQSV